MKKGIIMALSLAAVVSACSACAPQPKQDAPAAPNATNWNDYMTKYRNDDNVDQLILVQYTGGSNADVLMYEKDRSQKNAWTLTVRTDGFVGLNGITEDKKEGDAKTPIGDFGVVDAFGIKPDPGTELNYTDVTDTIYGCDEEGEYYNQIIDTAKVRHDCKGEHMIEYSPQYNYGMTIDYNKENKYPDGSAIFFHTKGAKSYTGGCIAVDEDVMVKILNTVKPGARVCINVK